MNKITPRGTLRTQVVRAPARPHIANIEDAIRYGTPEGGRFAAVVRSFGRNAARRLATWQESNAENFRRSLVDQAAHDSGKLPLIGHLWLSAVRRDGTVEDFGLVSCRVVTTTGVGYIVDAFQNLVEAENMKYHGLGTSAAAEAVGNTALGTELTTQYSSANTRPTGSSGELAGNPNIYETTATITVSAIVAATEHGILSQAAVGGGVLLDRSVFSVVNLAASESMQATYQLTFPAGG